MKYISNIFSTGAVRKTPKKIIRRIVNEVSRKDGLSIIEFGAGQGEITHPLIDEKLDAGSGNLSYTAFEIDPKFSAALRESMPRIRVLSEDAFSFQQSILEGLLVDYFICSMPLSFYPREKVAAFLQAQASMLKSGGKLIILFHAFWMIPFLKKNLKGARVISFLTIPPYFLLVFEKR